MVWKIYTQVFQQAKDINMNKNQKGSFRQIRHGRDRKLSKKGFLNERGVTKQLHRLPLKSTKHMKRVSLKMGAFVHNHLKMKNNRNW